jgi:hypothetical protein
MLKSVTPVVAPATPGFMPRPASTLKPVLTPASLSLSANALEGDDTNREPASAMSPEERVSLRESLRLAAADEDPDIAERAKDAYDDLVRDDD